MQLSAILQVVSKLAILKVVILELNRFKALFNIIIKLEFALSFLSKVFRLLASILLILLSNLNWKKFVLDSKRKIWFLLKNNFSNFYL